MIQNQGKKFELNNLVTSIQEFKQIKFQSLAPFYKPLRTLISEYVQKWTNIMELYN